MPDLRSQPKTAQQLRSDGEKQEERDDEEGRQRKLRVAVKTPIPADGIKAGADKCSQQQTRPGAQCNQCDRCEVEQQQVAEQLERVVLSVCQQQRGDEP